jgi:hypothetical protein
MPLSHYQNSVAAVNNYEPVFLNQFDVIITPPAIITNNVNLLVQHVKSIDGLPELTPTGVVKQYYKFASRSYAGPKPDQTDAQLKIEFEVNLNEDNDMYIYNILRRWADIVFNPLTGRQGLKKDYVGEVYVAQSNKNGDIFREWRFSPVYPFSPNKGSEALTPIKLDYLVEGEQSIYRLTLNLQADAYAETRIGSLP